MPGRVNADLLLVGSVPARSTEKAFRAGAAHFGDLVFALPDGETGPRSTWVGYERETLLRPSPAVTRWRICPAQSTPDCGTSKTEWSHSKHCLCKLARRS